MANLVTYAKQKWEDAKTAITAARLNNMEDGINNCATQINALEDSVSRATETVTSDFGKVEFLRNGPVLLVKATLHVDSAAVKSTWTDVCSVPRWAKVTSCWGTVKDFSGQDAGIWDIVDGKLKIYLNKVGGNDFNANGLMMLL